MTGAVMAVLSDRSIRQELARGRIIIRPLAPDAIQPASVASRTIRRVGVTKS